MAGAAAATMLGAVVAPAAQAVDGPPGGELLDVDVDDEPATPLVEVDGHEFDSDDSPVEAWTTLVPAPPPGEGEAPRYLAKPTSERHGSVRLVDGALHFSPWPGAYGKTLVAYQECVRLVTVAVVEQEDSPPGTELRARQGDEVVAELLPQVSESGSDAPVVCQSRQVLVIVVPAGLAAADDVVRRAQGEHKIVIDVLDNDPGAGTALKVGGVMTLLTEPTNGKVGLTEGWPDRKKGVELGRDWREGPAALYTPHEGFHGTDAFRYRLCSWEPGEERVTQPEPLAGCRDATVTVTIVPPLAVDDDTVRTTFETATIIDVLANDLGHDGRVEVFPRVSPTSPPSEGSARHGSPVVGEDGSTVTYTPDAGFVGTDRFVYGTCAAKLTEGEREKRRCDRSGVVTVTVTPDAAPDAVRTLQGASVEVDVLANDRGLGKGTVLSLSAKSGARHGTASLLDGDRVLYTPEPSHVGGDRFAYRVCTPDLGAIAERIRPRQDARVLTTVTVDDRVEQPMVCVDGVVTVTVDALAPATVTGERRSGPSTTPGDGKASKDNPVGVTVAHPEGRAAEIVVRESATPIVRKGANGEPTFDFGKAIDISVPDATPEKPLRFTFELATTALEGGVDPADLVVSRNGEALAACTSGDGSATPDPCFEPVTATDGSLSVTVRTSRASTWTFGVPATVCGSATDLGCLAKLGVARGMVGGELAPELALSRGQLASLLHRALADAGLVLAAGPDAFTGDDGTEHEGAINALAAAGLLKGDGSGRHDPTAAVTRDQAAALLVRAREALLGPAGLYPTDQFGDDDGSAHEFTNNLAHVLGLVDGADGVFDPKGIVLRRDGAELIARLLDVNLLARLGG